MLSKIVLKCFLSAAVFFGISASAFAAPVFTLSNSNGGDGYFTISGSTVQLFGADNNVGPSFTTYTATFDAATTETFNWTYNTFDSDGSVYDPAGYVLNGVYTQLSTNGYVGGTVDSSGTTTVDIPAGGVFGLYVFSVDSIAGRGEIAANLAPAAVTPEPSSLVLLGTGLFGALGAVRRRAKA